MRMARILVCCPLRFPTAYQGTVENYRLAVNDATTQFIGPGMPGFSEKGTIGFTNPGQKYVFYEGIDTSGNVLPQKFTLLEYLVPHDE